MKWLKNSLTRNDYRYDEKPEIPFKYLDLFPIYEARGAYTPIKTGNVLGQLTCELSGYGKTAFIDEYVALGPKTYSLLIKNEENDNIDYVVKSKGIQFKLNKDILTHEKYKELLQNSLDYIQDQNRNGEYSPTCMQKSDQ